MTRRLAAGLHLHLAAAAALLAWGCAGPAPAPPTEAAPSAAASLPPDEAAPSSAAALAAFERQQRDVWTYRWREYQEHWELDVQFSYDGVVREVLKLQEFVASGWGTSTWGN